MAKVDKKAVVQKILDTIYERLDTDISMEDVDYAALTLQRLKEVEEEEDVIVEGRHF